MNLSEEQIHIRINADLKQAAEAVFRQVGLSAEEAIRIFYSQVKLRSGIPFDVVVPNQMTLDAIDEARYPEQLERYPNFKALRKDLGV